MTDLTTGLAILGGLVLAGVVVHSTWKARRVAPRQAQPGDAGAPALDGRIEPPLDGLEPATRDAAAARGDIEGAGDAVGLSAVGTPAPERRAVLDPLIDVIAPLALEASVSGDAALAALPPTRRAGSKPFAVEGLNESTGVWEPPQAGRRYSAFQAGVQLANRMGALNEIEYSEFVMKARAFADAVGAEPEFPEMLEEVARARELDLFASEHDAQLGFVLRPRAAAWSPGYVQQHAARLGFVAGVIPGRMVLPAAVVGDPPLLGLTFDPQAALADDPTQAAIREVALSLDVPQVPRSERPFERLWETAQWLAQSMEGVVTDDTGRPIAAPAVAQISAELDRIYDTLDARELSAGSPLARRLFS